MKKLVRRFMLLSVMLIGLGFILTGNISSVRADPPCPESCEPGFCETQHRFCFNACPDQDCLDSCYKEYLICAKSCPDYCR